MRFPSLSNSLFTIDFSCGVFFCAQIGAVTQKSIAKSVTIFFMAKFLAKIKNRFFKEVLIFFKKS
jgi:hypothetical protein